MAATVIAQLEPPVLDNTIKPTADPVIFAADNGLVRSEFRQAQNVVIFERNGRRVSWTPLEMKYIDSLGLEDAIYSVQEVPLDTRASYARFNRVMPDIDDWFIQENDRLKHQVLVQGFQRGPLPFLAEPIQVAFGGRLQFDSDLMVWADGEQQVLAFETAGAIELRTPDGQAVFTLPPVVAYDSRTPERASTTGHYIIQANAPGDLSFYMAVANEWMTDPTRVYPVVVDPTIATATLTTSVSGATNQRKLAVAPSGDMYLAWEDYSNSKIQIYRSTDSGATWTNINWAATGYYYEGNIDLDVGSDNALVAGYIEQQTSGGSYNCIVKKYVPGSGWTARVIAGSGFSPGVLAPKVYTLDGQHIIVWDGKTGFYSSADGGITWPGTPPTSGVTVPGNNTWGSAWWDGTTFYVANGESASPYYPYIQRFTPSWTGAWPAPTAAVRVNATYGVAGSSTTAIIKLPSGALIVVWGTGSPVKLYYATSSDNGASWSAAQRVDPSATVDEQYHTMTLLEKLGKVAVTVRKGSSSPFAVGYLMFDGSTWGPHTQVGTGVFVGGAPKRVPAGCSYFPFWWSTVSSGTGNIEEANVFLNVPPDAPTNLVRGDFDPARAADFTWAFTDPDAGGTQQSYQLLIKRASDGVQVYDSGQVVSGTSKHTLPASTLTSGQSYQWQVRVWDDMGGVSPYSSLATFYASAPPTVTITRPAANGDTVYQPQLTAEWSVADTDPGDAQSAYRVRLLNAGEAQLYDSGKKTGSGKVFTVPYTMASATTYQVEVTVWDNHGIQSTPAVRSFVTDFVLPPVPTVVVTPEAALGRISVAYTNPAPGPDPNQPAASSVDVHRRESGGTTWTRIAAGLPTNSTYRDYAVASGQSYDYYVRARADNTASSDSAVATGTVTLTGLWLHDVADPAGTALNLAYYRDRSEDWRPEAALLQFAGRARPMAEFGEGEDSRFKVSVMLMQQQGTWALLDALAKRRSTVCIRDPRGRKLFGALLALPETDQHYGQSVSLELVQTAFTEEV